MATEQINEMAEIDATIDTSSYGIVEGVGVVEVLSSEDGLAVVDSNIGLLTVKSEEVKPYDGR